MTRVGFIGLGSQGGPMARRIVDDGFPLTIWARRGAALDPFRDTAARVANTPAEVGAASEVVGICVVDDADVEDVLLGDDGVLGGMSAGGVVAIHSTVHPVTCRRVAEAAAAREVAVVDAPVSGGGVAAAARRLLVMTGGEAGDVERCRPVFETFAEAVIQVGPLGSGQLAKLLNNLVFMAQVNLANDTFAFADRLGLDRAAFANVLAHGSGGSRAAATLAGLGFDATGISQAAPLLAKDLDIILDVARTAATDAPPALVELARRTLATLRGDA